MGKHRVGVIYCNWCGGKTIDRLTDIKRGSAKKYCSHSCATSASTLPQNRPGPDNGNWKGGVSNDNMRYRKRQLERWPLETSCRLKTMELIRKGILIRGDCLSCGKPNGHAHHSDYNDPFNVEWYCRDCHRELHKCNGQ